MSLNLGFCNGLLLLVCRPIRIKKSSQLNTIIFTLPLSKKNLIIYFHISNYYFLFQAILTSIFILVGNIKTLIEFASWFLWFFYGLAMVALLVLRKTQADKPRPYRVPTIVPCFVLLVAIFLSILPIVHDPSVKYLMAIGFIVLGVIVYTTFVYYKKTPTALLSEYS